VTDSMQAKNIEVGEFKELHIEVTVRSLDHPCTDMTKKKKDG